MGGDRPHAYLKYSNNMVRSNYRLRQNPHLSIGELVGVARKTCAAGVLASPRRNRESGASREPECHSRLGA
jgi:hypothetical protein